MAGVLLLVYTVYLSLPLQNSVSAELPRTYGDIHEVTEHYLHVCYTSVYSVADIWHRGTMCMAEKLYFMIKTTIKEQITSQSTAALHPPLYGKIWCTSMIPWNQQWQLKTVPFLAINATFLYFNLPIFTALCRSVNVSAAGMDTKAAISHVWCGRKLPWSVYTARDKHTMDVHVQSIYGLPLSMGFLLEFIVMDKLIQDNEHMKQHHKAHIIFLNTHMSFYWKNYCIQCRTLHSLHIAVLPWQQACMEYNFTLSTRNIDKYNIRFYDGPGIRSPEVDDPMQQTIFSVFYFSSFQGFITFTRLLDRNPPVISGVRFLVNVRNVRTCEQREESFPGSLSKVKTNVISPFILSISHQNLVCVIDINMVPYVLADANFYYGFHGVITIDDFSFNGADSLYEHLGLYCQYGGLFIYRLDKHQDKEQTISLCTSHLNKRGKEYHVTDTTTIAFVLYAGYSSGHVQLTISNFKSRSSTVHKLCLRPRLKNE